MDLIKLEIDGKRIVANNRQTILEAARANGIDSIPTLCHDEQLEPFSSCFVCVVKVQGARTLLPACSTRVAGGMVVETNSPEVRRSRRAALELMLSNHFADCVGPCQLACPADIDIQGYIAFAALGKHSDAIRLIKERNPLPAICGRVCTRPCEVTGCRRNIIDEPVGIDYIKRYLADVDLGQTRPFRPEVAPDTGKKIAIVGAGPAGLSCAYYLRLKGYTVQMFEGLPEAGGMLRYGIPEYRLPKDVLDLEINQILDLGVKLSTNVFLGRDFTVASLQQDGYEAVFLGLGAWKSSKMRVQDEETEGVLPGIEFLESFAIGRTQEISGTVLVVGGGNTAIDCARTAKRLGADDVKILYRRTRNEMPANEIEIDEAEQEGIDLQFLCAPVRVIQHNGRVSSLECIRMELGEPDASGRRSPKPVRGSEYTIDCSYAIAAIGQNTKMADLVGGAVPNFLPMGEVLNLTRWQTIQVDEDTFETSVEGVFSGGDVVTGAATAIEAIAAGRKAAYAIDAYITGGKAQAEPVEFCSSRDAFKKVVAEDLPPGDRSRRRQMPMLSDEERKGSFAEVELGYTTNDVKKEAHRCLECGCVALFDCDLRKHATDYRVDVSSFMGEAREYQIDRSHPLIILDPNKCILCGRCVRICSEIVGVTAYGFVDRGFETMVRPALGGSLLDTDCVSCGLCIGTCPTGAVAQKLPMTKPGPWETVPVETVCHYCGDGCRINYDTFGDSLFKVSRCEDDTVTYGNHCSRGRFGYNYIEAKDRLLEAKVRAGRQLQDSPLPDAIQFAGLRLKELCGKYSGNEIALFVSPRMTNEEIYLAQKFARIACNTHNVTSFANILNKDLFTPDVVSTASYHDIVDAQTILVVNSELSDENFAVDLLTKKAIRKGGRLIYIGPEANRTARFSDVFLKCKEGTQVLVLLGLLKEVTRDSAAALRELHPKLWKSLLKYPAEKVGEMSGVSQADLSAAAEIVAKSILKILICNKDYRGVRLSEDNRLIADTAEALGCSLLALQEKANAQGLLDMGANPAWLPGYNSVLDTEAIDDLEKEWCVSLHSLDSTTSDIGQLIREKKIKVAVVFGEDPFGVEGFPRDLLEGLLAAEFLVVGDLFNTSTVRMANAALPLSSIAETSGTMTNQERRIQKIDRAIQPLAGSESWQIICDLAAAMGYRFKMKYEDVSEIAEEIGRVVPFYGEQWDGSDRSGIWDIGAFRLGRTQIQSTDLTQTSKPLSTLHLDYLESRFARWYEELFEIARKAQGMAEKAQSQEA